MIKSEAKAILACQKKILNALATCEKKLRPSELGYFHSYWGGHIAQAMNGQGYGSAPIYRAERLVKDSET